MASRRFISPCLRLESLGDADDWTPVNRCNQWVATAQRAGHTLALNVYPGALHGFDAPNPPHMYAGHYVGRHPEAAFEASRGSVERAAKIL